MKLQFPILFFIDGALSVDKPELLKYASMSFPTDNSMLCMETVQDHAPGWIIEVTGKFRELTPNGKRREWARPLRVLWNFTLSEYAMSDPRDITIGEVKERLAGVEDLYPEAPFATDLLRHLGNFSDEEVLTEEILRAWPI